MSESRRTGLEIGVAALPLLIIGLVLLFLDYVVAGAVLAIWASWLLGVAAMYLDPPGYR